MVLVDLVFKVHRGFVTEAQAKEWFNIFPKTN